MTIKDNNHYTNNSKYEKIYLSEDDSNSWWVTSKVIESLSDSFGSQKEDDRILLIVSDKNDNQLFTPYGFVLNKTKSGKMPAILASTIYDAKCAVSDIQSKYLSIAQQEMTKFFGEDHELSNFKKIKCIFEIYKFKPEYEDGWALGTVDEIGKKRMMGFISKSGIEFKVNSCDFLNELEGLDNFSIKDQIITQRLKITGTATKSIVEFEHK